MKRVWTMTLGVVIGLGLVVGGIYYSVATREIPTEAFAALPLDKGTTDAEAFKALYPRHYDSYMKNKKTDPAPLRYGGSNPVSNLDLNPYMKSLWAGMAFSKEYNEDRGHLYTIEDVTKIARVNDKTTASCMYCKSSEIPALLAKYGDKFYTTPFSQIKQEVTHPITCSDCHDPTNMELRIGRPAVVDAMKRRGIDITHATRQEMGTYVCAQCHVEYFFNPKDSGRVTFPWDKGVEPEQIYAYYQEQAFADWTHPTSGAKMLKTQHPEFELFQGSTHQANGLSCATCHMPLIKEGTAKISSHWWTSPLRTAEQSCGQCHGQGADQLKQRILYTQDKVKAQMDVAGKTLESAHNTIGDVAKNTKADAKKLEEARALVREGQWYWDFIAADNSMGFHNPQKALDTLAKAIDRGNRATLAAKDALLAAK